MLVAVYARPPEAEEDPVRYRNLLRRAETALRERGGLTNAALHDFLAPLEALAADPDFWVGQLDGLAIFRSPGFVAVERLPEPVEEMAAVGARFRTRPLLPLLTQTGRYAVLAISQGAVTLYAGDPYGLEPLELPALPTDLWEAVGREPTQDPQNFKWRLKGRNPIYTGHGVGPNDNDDDLQRYFRAVDEVVCEQLKDEQPPLVLAGPSELWPVYRAMSRYPRLIEGGVEGNVDRDRPETIHARAWPLAEPLFEEPLRAVASLYRELAAKGRASDDLAEVADAVATGRAAALLLAERSTARAPDAEPEEAGSAGDGDLLEELAEETLRQRGKVYVLPPGLMPTDAPAAALFRY